MKQKTVNNIRLGLFVLSGILFLVLLLYMIGKNRNLFGSNFTLKARFQNVQGLVSGNDVRYAGISVGTVKDIQIVNDTLIEVSMLVDDKMKRVIHNNSIVSIGTDGLMGNKLVNISPSKSSAPFINEGDILLTRKPIDTEDMFQTLAKTNNDVNIIAENLKTTIKRVNDSKALWNILNDEELPRNIRASLINTKLATGKAKDMISDLQTIVAAVKEGKGSIGAVLKDTAFALNLGQAIEKIKLAGDHVNNLTSNLDSLVKLIALQVNDGRGPVTALLKDSSIVSKLHVSLDNIQKGTEAFNANMEALKHNFLFRGYFKKLEKQNQKQSVQGVAVQ